MPTTPNDLVFVGFVSYAEVRTELAPSSAATPIALGAFVVASSPIPSPAATYSPSATLYGVAYPSLAPNTTYSIQFVNDSNAPCTIPVESSGSFTTGS
ncbi:MAG: hypothetical protein IAI50_18110 [Candidatus Eremiobacteraeota bacterium]|nr:hypothetical protein [Candidatus Eremiobacteraeota bacterium]